jgi:hypothetical protein
MKIVIRAKPRQKSIALGSRIVAAAPGFDASECRLRERGS